MRLRQLLLLALVALSVATRARPDDAPIPRAGDPCPHPRYIAFEDGSQFLTLGGRVITRDRTGQVRPVKKAHLIKWNLRSNPKARPTDLVLDQDGAFEAEVGLSWSQQSKCENGVIVVTQQVSREQFLISAEGCNEIRFEAGADWSPRTFELKCRQSHR